MFNDMVQEGSTANNDNWCMPKNAIANPGQGMLPLAPLWRKSGPGFIFESYDSSDGGSFTVPALPMHRLAIPLRSGAVNLSVRIGRARIQREGAISPEDAFFIPAHLPSAWEYQGGCRCLNLWMTDAFVTERIRRRKSPTARLADLFPLMADPLPELAQSLRRAARAPSADTAAAASDALLDHCLGRGRKRMEVRGLPGEAFAKVAELVHTRLRDGVTVQEMAEAAGMSSAMLARKFKLAIGLSPYEYVGWARICRIRTLLCAPPEARLPMIEIAYQTGFSDQPHMNRAFRKLLGCTPGEYARGKNAE